MIVGDLYWAELRGGGGHAQAGRRPAIVMQGETASVRLPTVLVVPLTTQQDALRFPGTVLVEPTAQNGLRRTSVALVFQLTALDRRFLGQRMGRVSDHVVAALWAALDEIGDRAGREPREGTA